MKKEALTINNFKCFDHLEVSFPSLTVLVGANGMGKSTVVQSLLLMRSVKENDNDFIKLNGPYGLALGTNESVLCQTSKSNRIDFAIREERGEDIAKIRLRSDSKHERLDLNMITDRDVVYKEKGLFAEEFYYLSAERTGPRIAQKMVPLEYMHTGTFGEFSAQILSDKFLKIDKNRRHPSYSALYLYMHTNAWLNEILPGVEVTAVRNTSMQVSQVKIRNSFISDFVESTNIGFGISYSLPIVIQGLIAKAGRYFIVENPEAHLHPAAQTEMGKFLAMLAEKGLRVIVETHSDHLLDGIQLYLANHEKLREDVVIYHFSMGLNKQPVIKTITYDSQLDYSSWPKGFMDQTSINYSSFTEMR